MSVLRSLFVYRGIRIRPWFNKLPYIFDAVLALPLISALAYYGYIKKDDLLGYDVTVIVILVVALLFVFPLVHFLRRYLEERFLIFKKLQRLHGMAFYLSEQKYVIEKERKQQTGVKVRYKFPKIYMKQNRYDMLLYFQMQGSRFQEKFSNLDKELEKTFFMDCMERLNEEKFLVYRLAYSAFLNRINAQDVKYVEDKGLQLMKNLYWDFINDPHLLVVGGTGGGKTVFLREVLCGLLPMAIFNIADPKRADFVTLADLPPLKDRVVYEVEDIVSMIENNVAIMNSRYDHMREVVKKEKRKEMGSFKTFDMLPHFIMIDEGNALASSMDFGTSDRYQKALTQILLKGRQCGVEVILGMQKPSSDDLPTKFRSNMMHHISLGRLDDTGYTMTFGDENKNKDFKYVKYLGGKRVYGRGYSATVGEVAQEFYAPLLTKGFNFYDAIKELPFIPNRFDVNESGESGAPKVYSRQDILQFLSEAYPTLSVTEGLVRKAVDELKKSDYPMTIVEGQKVVQSSDLDMIAQIISERSKTDQDYITIINRLISHVSSM
ncbi:FtsK/SpoIIIE domain-containing protein [Streptococcus iniae]|nr:hypothetical protein BKX95_11550 [Streptococcus iniae]